MSDSLNSSSFSVLGSVSVSRSSRRSSTQKTRKLSRPMQSSNRHTASGAPGLPVIRASGSDPNIAIAVPIRPAATLMPRASASDRPRNHLTTALLAVMPIISTPTPKTANPSVAYSTCDLTEKSECPPIENDETAPPRSAVIAQYFSRVPPIISPTDRMPA